MTELTHEREQVAREIAELFSSGPATDPVMVAYDMGIRAALCVALTGTQKMDDALVDAFIENSPIWRTFL